jgi:hypothetical protein
MAQPQFIKRQVNTSLNVGEDGVALVGVMRTPDCNVGVPGVLANETLVMMARMDEAPPPKIERPDVDPSRLEVEAVVFDVPGSEAAAWPAPGEEPADDSERFAALLTRVDGKTEKIAAHVAVVTMAEERQKVFDDAQEASGDPFGKPHQVGAFEKAFSVAAIETNDSPNRYRPTAMYPHEIGTTLDAVGATADDSTAKLAEAKQVAVKYTLRHDVAPLQEPDYRSMIALAQKGESLNQPVGTVFEETWKGKAIANVGATQFIGARTPPGEKMKDRLHLAFLRVRVVK